MCRFKLSDLSEFDSAVVAAVKIPSDPISLKLRD